MGHHVRTVEVGDRVLFARDGRVEVQCTAHPVRRDPPAVATGRTERGTGLYL